MDENLKRGFYLGDWEVEPLRGQVIGQSGSVHVEPKVMEVLVALAARPGEVVERNHLVDEVWAGRIVSDEPLNRCIAELRRILNDSRTDPKYIQTVPKRGYRLIASVKSKASTEPNVESVTATGTDNNWFFYLVVELRRRRVFRMAAGYAIVAWVLLQLGDVLADPIAIPLWVMNMLILAVVIGFPVALACAWLFEITPEGVKFDVRGKRRRNRHVDDTDIMMIGFLVIVAALFLTLSARIVFEKDLPGPQPHEDAVYAAGVPIAVLPFVNLSESDETDYLSDGLTEEIMLRLAGVDGLTVAARTSVFSLKGSTQDAKSKAAALAVTFLLDGSVRRSGERIRVTAELVDASGIRLWSESYETIFDDVFELQDRIANDIVSQVRPALPVAGSDSKIQTSPPTENLDAYELVLRGRFHLQRREEGPLRKSMKLFEEAIALDEGYGDAYVGLATAHALLPHYSYESVDLSLERAMLTIDEGSRKDESVVNKAAGITAFILYQSGWRWIETEIAFRRAIENLDQNAELLQWYSQFLGGVGRRQQSLEYALRAKQMDRLSPVANHRVAIAYLWMNQNQLAEEHYQIAAELGISPAANAEAYLVLLLRLARYEEAKGILSALQKALGYSTDWINPVLLAIEDPALTAEAVRVVEHAEQQGIISKQYLFGTWVYLNEVERAIDTALVLIQDRESFNTEILFLDEMQQLREHPRFSELIRELGLHRYWDNFGWPEFCSREGEQIVCG